MSAWQPVHPIALWTDCANPSPGTCNESFSPLSSGFSSPAIPWQARHCVSPAARAAADAGAASPASASTPAATAAPIVPMANGLRPILPPEPGFVTIFICFPLAAAGTSYGHFLPTPAVLHETAAPVFDADQATAKTPRRAPGASPAEG